jgi:hypothetical protein
MHRDQVIKGVAHKVGSLVYHRESGLGDIGHIAYRHREGQRVRGRLRERD